MGAPRVKSNLVRLVERDEELAALHQAWERALSGRGGLLIVGGEPGTGKSALVEAFVEQTEGVAPTLWGAGDPLATPRPLGPVHDVAAQLGEPVPTLLREAEQPHEIFSAVFEHLRTTPSVLVIDDLHWADQGTVDLLRFVLRRVRSSRSLVIGTVRDDEVGTSHAMRSLLGDVARSPDASSLTLRPLSVAGVAELLADRPIDPAALHRLTAGNPFFVVEMLDHEGDDLPSNVRDAVLARTAPLDDEAMDLLHLLVCAPEAIPDRLLGTLGITLPPLRALDSAGLIRRGARGVAFRHDLCRLAVAGSLPPGGDVALHGRMLEALESSPRPDAAILAHHALGAGDEQRIRRYAAAAGRAAARSGAHTQAAVFFRTALDHGETDASGERAELLELLAHESYLIDRLDEAIACCERAMVLRARAGDAAAVSANHHALSVYEWYNANRAVAERHVDDAVATLEPASAAMAGAERDRLGHALAMKAFLALQVSELDHARSLVSEAARVASESDDEALHVRIALIEGIGALIADERVGRPLVMATLGSAAEHFDETYSTGYSYLSYLDIEQRRLQQASEVLATSLPLTIEHDVPICYAWQLGSRGRLELLRGDWDEALTDASTVLLAPSAPLARTWPSLVRGLVLLRRTGEPSPDLDVAWDLANRYREPIRQLPTAAALVEQAWLTGRLDERIDECRDLLATAPLTGLEWARGDLAVWLRRLDGDTSTHAPIERVAEPYRLQLAGDLDAAADTWRRLLSPYEEALTLVATDDVERRRAGLDLLDRLGAGAVAAKVRRYLRANGASNVPGPRRPATRRNAAGLTAREVDVLQLLDEGLTNAELAQRLYISQKTVDHHVSAILSKLQVANRRVATRTARELGLLD